MKLPTYVQIEPVGQCNLRCQMCSIQFRKDGPPFGPPALDDRDESKYVMNDPFVTRAALTFARTAPQDHTATCLAYW